MNDSPRAIASGPGALRRREANARKIEVLAVILFAWAVDSFETSVAWLWIFLALRAPCEPAAGVATASHPHDAPGCPHPERVADGLTRGQRIPLSRESRPTNRSHAATDAHPNAETGMRDRHATRKTRRTVRRTAESKFR
jgi:hypothetical protein